jgi:hypothetical protein
VHSTVRMWVQRLQLGKQPLCCNQQFKDTLRVQASSGPACWSVLHHYGKHRCECATAEGRAAVGLM